MTWHKNITNYENYLQSHKNFSNNTKNTYIREIMKLNSYCEKNLNNTQPIEINDDHLVKYLETSWDSDICERSQVVTVSAIKSFFKYLVAKKDMKYDPAQSLKASVLGIGNLDVLSVQQIKDMMSLINIGAIDGKRNFCIIEILYVCGLRFSELCALKLSNVNFEKSYLIIRRMGTVDRKMPLTQDASRKLFEYINTVRTEYNVVKRYSDYLFLNNRGYPVNKTFLMFLVNDLKTKIGATTKISFDTFRHSYATHLVQNGADLKLIQFLLVHRLIKNHEIYNEVPVEKLFQVVKNFHPRSCSLLNP